MATFSHATLKFGNEAIRRLYQTRQLVNKVRLAMEGDLSFDWLIPHMSCRSFSAGETRGDSARNLFLISAGTVRLNELRIEVGKASPRKSRTATAVAVTRVDVLAIAEDRNRAFLRDACAPDVRSV